MLSPIEDVELIRVCVPFGGQFMGTIEDSSKYYAWKSRGGTPFREGSDRL